MSAPSPDISEFQPAATQTGGSESASATGAGRNQAVESGEPESGAVPTGEPQQPDAEIREAVESSAAEPEPAGDRVAPDAELDLAAVIAQRDAYLEDLQRVTAEFTNFRRQTMKRNTELVAQAASRLARQLLVVLDACEAAVSQGVEGIDALQSQLLGVLSAEGLTVLGTVDDPFDPGLHEAVMSEGSRDGDPDAPVVAEVLRTGYAWNGRVLRPAMVKVRS